MKRGDLLIAVLSGDYGKPRPVVLVQNEDLFETESLLVCPLTSDTETAGPFRPLIDPTTKNGLASASIIMTDKVTAVPRRRCREHIGRLNSDQIKMLDTSLTYVLGLGD